MSKVRDGDILIILTLLINYENQVNQLKGGDDDDGGGVLPLGMSINLTTAGSQNGQF